MNTFFKNIINRLFCLLLLAVFLSTFLTGSARLAFCLDEQESHVVGKNFYLVDCHSSDEADRIRGEEHFSALVEKRENDCTDVSLANINKLNRSTRRTLPISAKVVFSYMLPSVIACYQQKVANYSLSVLSRPLFILPHINVSRTVVLLI